MKEVPDCVSLAVQSGLIPLQHDAEFMDLVIVHAGVEGRVTLKDGGLEGQLQALGLAVVVQVNPVARIADIVVELLPGGD